MGGTKTLRKRRDSLFKQHPYCHWCKCKLSHPRLIKHKQTQPDNMATIDHLRNRLDFNRTEPNIENQSRTVLSCKGCNEERGKESVESLSEEELWSRSGRYPISILINEQN